MTFDNLLARWTPAGGTAWYLTDRLGTIRDLAGQTGAIIDHLEYNSFGNVLSETNPSAGDRFKFTGREYDAETGLYYYRARYYDPHTGRFISEDPLDFGAGDTNLYRYVNNSPTDFIDPTGEAAAVETSVLLSGNVTPFLSLPCICLENDTFNATIGGIPFTTATASFSGKLPPVPAPQSDVLPWRRIKASIGSGGRPVNESKASPSAESQAVQTFSSSNETSICDSAEYFYHTGSSPGTSRAQRRQPW